AGRVEDRVLDEQERDPVSGSRQQGERDQVHQIGRSKCWWANPSIVNSTCESSSSSPIVRRRYSDVPDRTTGPLSRSLPFKVALVIRSSRRSDWPSRGIEIVAWVPVSDTVAPFSGNSISVPSIS